MLVSVRSTAMCHFGRALNLCCTRYRYALKFQQPSASIRLSAEKAHDQMNAGPPVDSYLMLCSGAQKLRSSGRLEQSYTVSLQS